MKSFLKTLMYKCALTMIVLLCAPFAIQGFAQTTTIYNGQFTVGGGYSTMVTLINTGSTDSNGTVFFTDQQGNPFTVSDGNDTASSSVFEPVRPGGTSSVTLLPVNPGDPTKSGWMRVEYTGGSLRVVATFLLTEGSTLKTIAGVLSSQPVPFATIPVDNSVAGNRFTGFAVANQNSSSISIRLVTLNEGGAIVDNLLPTQLNLGARSQTAIFLHQILANRSNFKGSVVLVGQGGQSIVVVALVVNQGLLTVIPAIPEKAPHVPN